MRIVTCSECGEDFSYSYVGGRLRRRCAPCAKISECRRDATSYGRRRKRGAVAVVMSATCASCGETKPAAAFQRHRGHSNGLASYCRACTAAARAARFTDPAVMVRERIRHKLGHKRDGRRIGIAVRRTIIRAGVEAFLGYTASDLKKHLQRRFKAGMSWDRFADIHVGHVLALKNFDLDTEDGVRAAWALTNLQPVWAERNERPMMASGKKRVDERLAIAAP